MALVVEDGTGLETAEALISVADADTYFTSGRGASSNYTDSGDWLHADTTTAIKEACLRWGMRLIASLWLFDGERSTEDQALPIPRIGMEVDGIELAEDEVPENCAYANAEMARALLLDVERTGDQEASLSELGVGPIKLVFDKYDRAKVLPLEVRDLLSNFGRPKGGRSRQVERA